MGKVTFDNRDRAFHALLKSRVNTFFEENRLSPYADWRMILKSIFWLTLFFGIFALYSSGVLPVFWAMLLAALTGFIIACIGFNVGHDAIHDAYSKNRRVNRVLSRTFDLLGASSFTWAVAHNFLHHTYTNVPGVDTDLDPGPFMRFSPRGKRYFFHRLQHLYAWPLYCFTSMVWVFKKDFQQMLTPEPRSQKRATGSQVADVLLGKLAHFAFFIGLPFFFSDYAVGFVLLGYTFTLMMAGLTLALVFQLAHCVEGPDFPNPNEEGVLKDAWAQHQMRTTANFSVGGKLATFIVGGLNHQVEHHLFSRICHIHYPALAPIVKKTAAAFDLPYHDNGPFFSALASHYRTMRWLGSLHKEASNPVPSAPPMRA
jgi:linoleoyl-CoA desaturase